MIFKYQVGYKVHQIKISFENKLYTSDIVNNQMNILSIYSVLNIQSFITDYNNLWWGGANLFTYSTPL